MHCMRDGSRWRVSIVGDTLTIKGEVKHETEKEEKGQYHYRERRYGAFRRSVTLPTNVDTDAAETVLERRAEADAAQGRRGQTQTHRSENEVI